MTTPFSNTMANFIELMKKYKLYKEETIKFTGSCRFGQLHSIRAELHPQHAGNLEETS